MLTTTKRETKNLLSTIEELIHLDGDTVDEMFDDEHSRSGLLEQVVELCQRAYRHDDANALFIIQQVLYKIYNLHLSIPVIGFQNPETSSILMSVRNIIERYFIEYEDGLIAPQVWDEAPREYEAYKHWLLETTNKHPAFMHPLYEDYLCNRADVEGLRLFLIQETTIDTRFDDFLALVQVGTQDLTKLEIATNYWDEMGRGEQAKMHTAMFMRTLKNLDIDPDVTASLTTEALVCGNLSLMLSLRRKYFYKSIGYFAITEHLAPRRFEQVIVAWERNGLDSSDAEYHKEHVEVDGEHTDNWFKNVIKPAIDSNAEAVVEITRGAFYRLNTSHRYLNKLLVTLAS